MKQIVQLDQVGMRLDHLLNETLKAYSRSYITQMIKSSMITVNDLKVKAGYIVKAGDVIDITEQPPKPLDLTPVEMPLDIVYEDDHLLVIDKPQGLVVHPAQSYKAPTLVHGLLHQQEKLSAINGVIRPGIVHRIDKDTSGLLVVAKTDEAHKLLSEALKTHDIERTYLAIVYGQFKEKDGTIDAPIKRSVKNRLKMAVDPMGKRATTHFTVEQTLTGFSLIKCRLETGRTHQIRVHMAYIGHPIVGDPLYGPKPVIGEKGQMLHACELRFMHPIKKEMMTFRSDIPSDFQTFLDQL